MECLGWEAGRAGWKWSGQAASDYITLLIRMEKGKGAVKAEQQQRAQKLQQFESYFRNIEPKFTEIKKEIADMPKDVNLFKNHQLPLARIKKIMKSDEDVRMISSETPVLFAKACEAFIIELTYRAWAFTLESKRRTLQKSDVYACIYNTEIFDFLIDIIPNEELKALKKYPAEGMFQVLPSNRQHHQK